MGSEGCHVGKVTPEWFREKFPDAKLICECALDRDTCPGSCEHLQAWRGVFAQWLADADVDVPEVADGR